MIYPFIYTRTKYHDYRILTTKSLGNLPREFMTLSRSIARAMIDADNDSLKQPTWTLVKSGKLIIWGLACVNSLLSEKSLDKTNRPTRGFFGIIVETSSPVKLPFNIDFFKYLYDRYVTPIWETLNESDEIEVECTIPSDGIFIYPSALSLSINFEKSICRIQPYTKNVSDLLATVLGAESDNSIALNIHNQRQIIDIGNDSFSFMNVIMSEDSNIQKTENITIEPYGTITQLKKSSSTENSYSKESKSNNDIGKINNWDLTLSKTRKKRNTIKYYVYGVLILFCLFLIFKGSIIWDWMLNSEKSVKDNCNIEQDEIIIHPINSDTIIQCKNNQPSKYQH